MRGSKPAGFSSTEVTAVASLSLSLSLSTPRRLDLCSCRWWDARQKPISLIAKAARSARGQIRGSSFQTANNGPTGTRQVQPTHDNPLVYSIRVTSHLCQRQLRQITDICFTHICFVATKIGAFPPLLHGIRSEASWSWHRGTLLQVPRKLHTPDRLESFPPHLLYPSDAHVPHALCLRSLSPHPQDGADV